MEVTRVDRCFNDKRRNGSVEVANSDSVKEGLYRQYPSARSQRQTLTHSYRRRKPCLRWVLIVYFLKGTDIAGHGTGYVLDIFSENKIGRGKVLAWSMVAPLYRWQNALPLGRTL